MYFLQQSIRRLRHRQTRFYEDGSNDLITDGLEALLINERSASSDFTLNQKKSLLVLNPANRDSGRQCCECDLFIYLFTVSIYIFLF
jgi:hypothetical protein